VTLPPGPGGSVVFNTLRWIARPVPFMDDAYARYGDVYTVTLLEIGTFVTISDPAEIKRVFTAPADVMHAGEAASTFEPVFGPRSLFMLDGREHLRERKLMLPPFHGERLAVWEDTMAAVTEAALATWPRARRVELRPLLGAIALEVILRVVFGIDDAARRRRVGDALVAFIDAALSPGVFPRPLRRDLGPGSPWRRFTRARDASDALLHEEIAARRADPRIEERDDVLSMLLLARDEDGEPMSEGDVRDQLMTLLLAGHETTATTLAWAYERLFRVPEVYARVRERREPEYIDAVIKETLRMRPVVPSLGRILQEPWEIRGWTIPAGVGIAPCIWNVHMRPDIYPEPRRFRPERFLESPPDSYEWLPFGGGVRRCLGASFAQLEMRVVLRTLLEQADISAGSAEWEPTTHRAVVLAPRHGTRAVVA
jgi:cytochrome P450